MNDAPTIPTEPPRPAGDRLEQGLDLLFKALAVRVTLHLLEAFTFFGSGAPKAESFLNALAPTLRFAWFTAAMYTLLAFIKIAEGTKDTPAARVFRAGAVLAVALVISDLAGLVFAADAMWDPETRALRDLLAHVSNGLAVTTGGLTLVGVWRIGRHFGAQDVVARAKPAGVLLAVFSALYVIHQLIGPLVDNAPVIIEGTILLGALTAATLLGLRPIHGLATWLGAIRRARTPAEVIPLAPPVADDADDDDSPWIPRAEGGQLRAAGRPVEGVAGWSTAHEGVEWAFRGFIARITLGLFGVILIPGATGPFPAWVGVAAYVSFALATLIIVAGFMKMARVPASSGARSILGLATIGIMATFVLEVAAVACVVVPEVGQVVAIDTLVILGYGAALSVIIAVCLAAVRIGTAVRRRDIMRRAQRLIVLTVGAAAAIGMTHLVALMRTSDDDIGAVAGMLSVIAVAAVVAMSVVLLQLLWDVKVGMEDHMRRGDRST